MPIQIIIEYLMRGKETAQELILPPELYFDPLEEGETFVDDGIGRFDHAKDYLDIPTSELLWTKLTISGTTDDREIRTQFLPDGESFLCHHTSPDGYEEFISSTRLEKDVFHILRIHKKANQPWLVNYNAIIKDMPDGSQQEFRYDKL